MWTGFINISDPTAPTFVETFDTPVNAKGIQVADNVLFVADDTGGVQSFDVSQYTDRNVTLSLDWPDEPNVTWPNELTEEGTAEVEVEVEVTNPDGTTGTQTQTETRTPGSFTYTFSLPKPAPEDIVVNFNIRQPIAGNFLEESTFAIAGTDYSGVTLDANGNGTITILEGQTSATLTLTPRGDSLVENPEDIVVTILAADNGTDYRVGTSEAVVGTITSDDIASVSLRVSPTGSIEEGGTITYTFERTGLPLDSLTVYYELDGIADTNDYRIVGGGSLNGEISFDRGETIQTITLETIDDLDPEDSETIEIKLLPRDPIITDVLENSPLSAEEREALLARDNYRVSTKDPVVATILDNEPEVNVSLSPSRVSENGDGTLQYVFTFSRDVTTPIDIRYILGSGTGTATFNADYQLLAGSANVTNVTATGFTISSGNTATILVDPTPDTDDLETDETISLTLNSNQGYTIGTPDAVVGTIVNVDTFDPNTAPFEPLDLFVRGNYVYSIDELGLTVSDVQTLTNPNPDNVKYFFRATGASAVQVIRDYAYIGDESGIRVVAISDPTTMRQVDFVATPQPVEGLWVDRVRGVIFASLGSEGFAAWQVDINNPDISPLIPLAGLNTAGSAKDVYTLGDFAYVADGDRGLRIIDISNLDDPALADNAQVFFEVGDYNTPGDAQAVKVVGNYAYIADGASGLQIIDISNPSRPVLAGQLDVDNNIQIGNAVDLDVVGPFAFVSDGEAGVYVIDISDPANPFLVETFDTDGQALGVQLVDDELFVADETGGIARLDVSEYTARNVTLTVASSTDPESTEVTESGTSSLVYTFTISKPASQDTVINYRILQPGDFPALTEINTTGSDDYTGGTPGTGEITILAGQTSANLLISPINDGLVERPEDVIVELLTGQDYYATSTEPVYGTILSENKPQVSLTVSRSEIFEDDPTGLTFTFTRTGLAIDPLTVDYFVYNSFFIDEDLDEDFIFGDSADSNDYTPANALFGQVTFAAGGLTQTVTIFPVDDNLLESDETVAIRLSSSFDYDRSTTQYIAATILDNEPIVTVELSPTSAAENSTVPLVYKFTILDPEDRPVNREVTISYSLGGTATRGLDYTVTAGTGISNLGDRSFVVAPGQTEVTLTITPLEDALLESNETVIFSLGVSNNYRRETTDPVVGTIVNVETFDPNTEPFEPNNVFVRGFYAYTVDENGLTISSVETSANPNPDPDKYFFRATGATSVQVVRDYAYIGDASGIRVISIVDPSAMEQVDFVATTQPVKGLWVDRERGVVFAAIGSQGFSAWQVDINNPDTVPLTPLSNLNTSGFANDVFTLSNYAYVADGSLGLRIIDVSALDDPALADNPNTFFEVGDYNTSGDALAVKVVGNYAYVADGASGLQIIDISNPSAPVLVGQFDTPGNAVDVDVVGPFAYIADDTFGVHVINVDNPTAPALVETFDTPGNALGIQVADNILFVADVTGELQRFDVSQYTDRNVTLSGDRPQINENGTIETIIINPDGTRDVETINVGFFTYTFSLPKPAAENITINFNIQQPVTLLEGDTIAVADDPNNPDDSGDYSTGAVLDANGNGSITILAGQSSTTLRIVPNSDFLVEGPESINVRLLEGDGYFPISTAAVTSTIISQDLPNITVQASVGGDSPSTNEVNVFEDSGETVTYTFRRSDNPQGRLVVFYSLTGSAASSVDYTGPSRGEIREVVFDDPGTIRARLLEQDPTLDPDEATREARRLASEHTITITPIANDVFEEDQKTVEVKILSEVEVRAIQLGVDNIGFFENTYSIGTTNTVITNIIEDDPEPPIIQVSLDPIPSTISERNTEKLEYTFSLVDDAGSSASFNKDLIVNFNLGGTARRVLNPDDPNDTPDYIVTDAGQTHTQAARILER